MSNFGKLMQQAAAGSGGGDFYEHTIDNSILLSHDSSQYLRRYMETNSSTNTDKKKGVISFWFKNWKTRRTNRTNLYNHMDDGYELGTIEIANATTEVLEDSIYMQDFQYDNRGSWSGSNYQLDAVLGISNNARRFRDRAGWYHYCFIWDTTQASATDRVKVYINGELQGWTHDTTVSSPRFSGVAQLPTLNEQLNYLAVGETSGSTSCRQYIGAYGDPWTYTNQFVYSDVQMAEFQAIDGTAYDISKFGKLKNGIWIPVAPSGISYGTAGSYLKFNNSGSLGADSSGNGNDWTVVNGATQLNDTPTNNFATFDPNFLGTFYDGVGTVTAPNITGTNGNLNIAAPNSPGDGWGTYSYLTQDVLPGMKTYVEFSNLTNAQLWVVRSRNKIENPGSGLPTGRIGIYSGGVVIDGSASGSSSGSAVSFTSSDTLAVAVDYDNHTSYWYKNNTLFWTVTNMSFSGTTYREPDGYWIIYTPGTSGATGTARVNTGQTAFTYTPPTGFEGLSTATRTESTLNPAGAENTLDYFNVVTYTGNGTAIGSGGKSVTGVGFQPDMVWTKNRDAAQSWAWMDTQIGAGKYWTHNYTSTGVITNSESLSSMDADGFTVGNLANVNVNAQNYIAYCFKKKAGFFDIVGYSGTGSVQNIAHGLGVAPKIIIVKRVTNANTAPSYFDSGFYSDPQTDFMGFFDTNAFTDENTIWNDTAPTSTQFTVGTNSGVNLSSDTFIAYLFAEVEGMTKMGYYKGNNSTPEGPFEYTGFKPAFVILKNISNSGYHFVAVDNKRKRENFNPQNGWLYMSGSDAEVSNSSSVIDFYSHGFKLRADSNTANGAALSYAYIAFAHSPFKYANAG